MRCARDFMARAAPSRIWQRGTCMWVRVLGFDAGDGWLPCRPRTQSSIAISADYERWFLLNASPDVGGQIAAFPALWPRESVRHMPIQAVVLTDTELDHTLGLLSLREGRYVRVYATDWVHTALSSWNPLLRTLGAYCRVDWQPLRLGQTLVLSGP